MAFVVEDGTGLTTSTSYVSLTEADAYFADRGIVTWPIFHDNIVCTFVANVPGDPGPPVVPASPATITIDDGTEWYSFGMDVGYRVYVESALNSGWFTITAITDNVISVSETTIVAEASVSTDFYTVSSNTGWTGGRIDWRKQVYLMNATKFIDGYYLKKFPGYRHSDTQALEWPRENAFDVDGWELSGIPQELKDGVCEAALLDFQGSSLISATYTPGLKKERVKVGPIEKEQVFFANSSTAKETTYQSIISALGRILINRGFSSLRT